MSWNRVVDCNIEKLRYYNNAWQSHAERVGRPGPWPLPRAQGIAPLQRGGRARRAAAEYQPGYDGLPGGAQSLHTLASIAIRTLLESTTR